MTDETERRETPTDLAPPPSDPGEERITLPPDAIDDKIAHERQRTLVPERLPIESAGQVEKRPAGASRAPSDFFEAAYEKLIEVHTEQQQRDSDLYNADGKFAGLIGSLLNKSLDGFAAKLEPRFVAIEGKDKAQDAKLVSVTEQLARLADRIGEIERHQTTALQSELRDIKASVASLIESVEAMSGADKAELIGRTVLLVDDHDLILKSLSRVIGSHGATVVTAPTLAAVQALVEQQEPDCVVVDVRLADGEDGTKVVEWLLARGFDRSRLVLMTGDAGTATAATATRLGVELLEKPVPAGEFVRVIRAASSRAS